MAFVDDRRTIRFFSRASVVGADQNSAEVLDQRGEGDRLRSDRTLPLAS